MSYGVVHQFKGGTKEQYEASIAAVHPADGGLPTGQLFHAAGPSDGGWTIMAVHDSRASWETFRDSILVRPACRKAFQVGSPRHRRKRDSRSSTKSVAEHARAPARG